MENLRISTMTCISKLSNNINLNILFDNLEINDNIRYIEHGENNYKGYAKKLDKKPRKKKENKSRFYNQSTLHLFINKLINIKLFNNGKIQLTGIKKEDDILPAIQLLIIELSNKQIISKDTIIEYYDIVMINSDFDIGYKLNREMLYRHILSMGIFCTYEPCTYPGVNIKYYVNNKNNGICNCSNRCNGKGKDDQCKKVTVAVFKSGKIIITGAQTLDQVKEVHTFIKNLLINKKNQFRFLS